MPFYVADYLADTPHLTAAEHGAYLLLLMHQWQNGSLPSDDHQLCRIARVHPPNWSRIKSTLEPFFRSPLTPGSWESKRMKSEISKAAEISSKRKAAAMQMHSKSKASAEQKHTQPQSQSHARANTESQSQGSKWRVAVTNAFREAGYAYPPDTELAEQWQADGYDFETTIKVVKELSERNKKIKTLRYFQDAIEEAHARRPNGQVKSNGTGEPSEDQLKLWKFKFDVYLRGGKDAWLPGWGSDPRFRDCEIPRHLIEEWSKQTT